MPESLFAGITFHKDMGKTYASADFWLPTCTLFLLLESAAFTTLFSQTVVQVSGVNLKTDTQQVIFSQLKEDRTVFHHCRGSQLFFKLNRFITYMNSTTFFFFSPWSMMITRLSLLFKNLTHNTGSYSIEQFRNHYKSEDLAQELCKPLGITE